MMKTTFHQVNYKICHLGLNFILWLYGICQGLYYETTNVGGDDVVGSNGKLLYLDGNNWLCTFVLLKIASFGHISKNKCNTHKVSNAKSSFTSYVVSLSTSSHRLDKESVWRTIFKLLFFLSWKGSMMYILISPLKYRM